MLAGRSLAISLQCHFSIRVAMPFSILVFQAFSVCTLSRQWIQQHVPQHVPFPVFHVSPGLPSFIFSGFGPFGPFGPCQDLLHEGQSVVKRLLFCPANIWPSATSANRLQNAFEIRDHEDKKHLAQKHHSHPFIAMQNQVKRMLVEQCQGNKSDKRTHSNCSL